MDKATCYVGRDFSTLHRFVLNAFRLVPDVFMAKRKRKDGSCAASKRLKTTPLDTRSYHRSPASQLHHPVLSRYYPRLVTLRQYLADKLSASSKKRQRRLLNAGRNADGDSPEYSATLFALSELLDDTIVGINQLANQPDESSRAKDLEVFTQQLSGSSGADLNDAELPQPEAVHFVVWLLFRRHPSLSKPPHLLCTGYQRSRFPGQDEDDVRDVPDIPGILSNARNKNVEALKSAPWCTVRELLGKGGHTVMIDLLMDCGIFYGSKSKKGFYYQLSGLSLIEMRVLGTPNAMESPAPRDPQAKHISHAESVEPKALGKKPTGIKFIRARMFYAKASLLSSGHIRFGLQSTHALNRLHMQPDKEQLTHMMKYIFPRQFGLHNVFTSQVDYKDTALQLKDYTLREKEITQQYARLSNDTVRRLRTHLPKRLRGEPARLIDQLQKLHRQCAYYELLRYYCPIETSIPLPGFSNKEVQTHRDCTEIRKKPESPSEASTYFHQVEFTDLASSIAQVSAFCRAVISRVVPDRFWGERGSDSSQHNYVITMRYIDKFIRLRKFETLSLHQVVHGIKIQQMSWLRNPRLKQEAKLAASDFAKRQELVKEFLYYLFDSLLIPLIRSNFYVTESNVHKQRLFYFRHDVWRMLSEPSLSLMKISMFEEMQAEGGPRLLASRHLGYSQVRLLPKKVGARPIMNLRRRMQINKGGQVILGRSINATLASTFNVLNYEKTQQPERLGSSLFSVGDMLPRLQMFRRILQQKGLWGQPLHFCKVDVMSCFDTIPQQHLLDIIEEIISVKEYDLHRYVEIALAGSAGYFEGSDGNSAPVARFKWNARPAKQVPSVEERIRNATAAMKPHTILVDLPVQQQERRSWVVSLLREHVQKNLVKIGRKFYRQKNGIPQGSVLSTLLCNFFYAALERDHLPFVTANDSMLMRLLDDFLLITTSRSKAEQFLRVMHNGSEEYGVKVKKEKSFANFDAMVDGTRLARPSSDPLFPYCGALIDSKTLEVRKNPEQRTSKKRGDALTVDTTKLPGQTFHRKTLNAFKIQTHGMFVDGSFNSKSTILSNLFYGFRTSAERCWEYLKELGKRRKPASGLLIKTVEDLIALGYLKLRRGSNIHRRYVKWLACMAFHVVFQPRQTRYADFLRWTRQQLATVRPDEAAERRMLERASRM